MRVIKERRNPQKDTPCIPAKNLLVRRKTDTKKSSAAARYRAGGTSHEKHKNEKPAAITSPARGTITTLAIKPIKDKLPKA